MLRNRFCRAPPARTVRLLHTTARQQDGVLVGCDDSERSFKNIAFAAKHFPGKRIDLVMCFDVPVEVFPMAGNEFATGENASKVLEHCAVQLKELETAVRVQHPEAHLTTTAVYGDPRYQLMEKAKELDSDAVIVGSHGKGFLSRVLLGSVAQHLANHLDRALVIVR